jgi:hypothetical protein
LLPRDLAVGDEDVAEARAPTRALIADRLAQRFDGAGA